MRSLLDLPYPGTDAEEAAYALREAADPSCAEFAGGDCGFAVFILVVAAIVLVVLVLNKEGKL